MRRQTNRSNRRRKGRANNQRNGSSKQVQIANREGTANRAPDNSGTVQIPKPLTARNMAVRGVYKATYQITTVALQLANFGTVSLYSPFTFGRSTASGGFSTISLVPADLTAMYGVFGLYKPLRVQLIFQPTLVSGTSPLPYSVCMDLNHVVATAPTEDAILDHSNSIVVSSQFPDELKYKIPPISLAQGETGNIYQGGWIDTRVSNESTIGSVNFGMTPVLASTSYTRLYIVYEIAFKNQQ